MRNTIIAECKTSLFRPVEIIGQDVYIIRWGKEIKGDYCTYETVRWYGKLLPHVFIKDIQFLRRASMQELNDILPDTYNKFEVMKQYLLLSILEYDKSINVNLFYIGEYATWLDKATRVGLKLRFESELAQSMEATILWQDGINFTLSLEEAMSMLYAIELYASACYDNTLMHLSLVKSMKTIDELLTYDYTVGYPEKLRF